MKSKLMFDINEHNQAVITANVILTDDLRDKTAIKFIERLGGDSNLLLVHFTLTEEGERVNIKSFGGSKEETSALLRGVSIHQLKSLEEELPKELKRREDFKKNIPNKLKN
ncbi:hypothetical protein [uncultured Clostridium sp.]|uniref:hypothetical protein n=1 Tax=uncultured Clostridium sp. TaxID=59620 RepID=UPI0026196B92|nr:hypothetical protein [uncultured Clostridium sp.]